MNEMSDLNPLIEALQQLQKSVHTALKKVDKKMEKQKLELEQAGEWFHFQTIGDTLLSQPKMITKGLSILEVENIHTHAREQIKLNPQLSAVENANLFYKKARKGKRGLEICESNMQNSNREKSVLMIISEKIGTILNQSHENEEVRSSWDHLQNYIRQHDQDAAYLLPFVSGSGEKSVQENAKVPYRHYVVDGWNIYIGKNNTQNDELSIHFAKPWYVWLHVVAHAGSHVVIHRQKDAAWPPAAIIETAARFAVFFSKAKHTSYAEVHVTEARFVHKRRKSPPGEVIAERCKTVRVSPISPEDFFKQR
ncbi:MAG: DUF814 domain-containing protein [Chitinivibrionales bacterium]|nr:DUF814 domain-containing protein [Chitinivibrionales bacterium]